LHVEGRRGTLVVVMEPDPDDTPLPAGPFSAWLVATRAAIRGEADAEVPCGTCTACCTASQFVHVGPDETDTLAHIPAALLFPAPKSPAGHVVMGYDERGHCPMLVDDGCSIYEHRPRTCRTYDCRVFAATGIAPDDDGDETKALIGARARRWRFDYAAETDRADQASMQSEAASLTTGTPTERAVRVVIGLATDVPQRERYA
jgi:Fe-S-cluster containining protein